MDASTRQARPPAAQARARRGAVGAAAAPRAVGLATTPVVGSTVSAADSRGQQAVRFQSFGSCACPVLETRSILNRRVVTRAPHRPPPDQRQTKTTSSLI